MAIKNLAIKFPEWFNKYKFTVLIVAIGLILMLIPIQSKSDATATENTNKKPSSLTLENRLTEILGAIEGVGKVKVLLTIAEGEETKYQTDDAFTNNADSTKEDRETVTVTDASRNQLGLIKQTIPPIYLGAIIACQGADDPIIKYAITDAVSKATGLRSNQISVLKMK